MTKKSNKAKKSSGKNHNKANIDRFDGNYISSKECKKNGSHLTNCDEDGYCNYCGKQ